MRGELCVGAASILSLASLLLLIFVHVSQINTSSVPRSISLVKIDVSAYGASLHKALFDDIDGLYATNGSAPLEAGTGLRQLYFFGLYSHCGYLNDSNTGTCTNTSIQNQFTPYAALTSDMLSNYTEITNFILSETTFANSDSFGHTSRAAYWMLLLGTICAALSLFTGVVKFSSTFFLSTITAIVGSIFLLIGATIWTVLIKRAQTINTGFIPAATPVPAGIVVSVGKGLFLIWAAFVTLVVSVVPYMISCCTFRG
ncbi:actin cortical patch SUR7/pH-response regulator pali [Mycena sanguinolenta]|nr:actin cortical patch SUR7/pH-response regulator pali [Mycena sanguinolenta]